jgi:hypothetical protein
MKRMTVVALFLGFWAVAPARAGELTATVDRPTVGLNEQFTLMFTVTNAGLDGGKEVKLPDLGKFRIMSGPSRSSSVQIINGSISSSVVYAYILEPREVGKFTIGAASVEVEGKTLTSAPITVEVVKSAPQQKQQAAGQEAPPGAVSDNLFLKATVDRTHVMQGEQINISFKLYTRVSVNNYAVEKNPNMTGFWGEEVEVAKDIRLANEVVNGKQYRVGVIKRMALFPTQAGNLEVSPMEVQATVQVQDRRALDPFDSFFRDPFGRAVNYKVASDAIKIKVDPLPADAPADFKGAVGQYAMSATVDKKTTRTNEPVSLKVTISGTGNIKLIESPTVDLPADFEQYTPKVTDNIDRTRDKVTGSKTFEYLLIPRYPGVKVIKPVSFSYFDPVKKEYVKLHTPQIDLNVEQGTAAVAPMIAGGTREDVQLLSQDIRFIKLTESGLTRGAAPFHTSGTFIAMLLMPLAGLAGAFVLARRRQIVMTDQAGYRNRQALKVAKKGLKQAEYLLKEKGGSPASNQRLRFYSEVSRALWKYLGDKLGIPQAEFSVEGAAQELHARGTDQGLIAALKKILETCDMARFAPTSLEVAVMQKTYDEAQRIIVELERTLK